MHSVQYNHVDTVYLGDLNSATCMYMYCSSVVQLVEYMYLPRMCSVNYRGLKSRLKYSLVEPDPPLRESGSARLAEVAHKK